MPERAESLSDLTAVILAGGLGTRLRDTVRDRPKVLADVSGRPFLAYILNQLQEYGIGKVLLCTGYLGEQIEKLLGDRYGKMKLSYSREPKPLGTAGALRLALPLIQSDPCLILNGDSICLADLNEMFAWHVSQNSSATILAARVEDTTRYGEIQSDPQSGTVIRFNEKHATSQAGWINAGVYLLSSAFLETIPGDRIVSLEREIFPSWIGRGLLVHRTSGCFMDIGTPESLHSAADFFQN